MMDIRKYGRAVPQAALMIVCLAVALSAGAQDAAAPTIQASVDWTAGIMHARVSVDIVAAGIRLPSGRAEAERLLERSASDLVEPTVLAIAVDSYRTVADTLDDGSLDTAGFRAYLDSGVKRQTAMSADGRSLSSEFEWKLADLAGLYVRHSAPLDLPPAGAYVPTKSYTGIVVYLKGDLPVRGEHDHAQLQPCLFPKLWDENMNVLMDRNRMSPELLSAWGPVAYATDAGDPSLFWRVGDDPLRVMAQSIFGSFKTDAVITRADAQRILGDPVNRSLIRDGRIVFVVDQP